jgi:putative redox protein
MKAVARRSSPTAVTHRIEIRRHELTVDEPTDNGGDDEGPTPQELLAASLAACTAITIELYARRKGWDIGAVEVECEYTPAERGATTNFTIVLKLPSACTQEQLDRLQVIAGKCPVHRTLAGEVSFDQRLDLVEAAAG